MKKLKIKERTKLALTITRRKLLTLLPRTPDAIEDAFFVASLILIFIGAWMTFHIGAAFLIDGFVLLYVVLKGQKQQ